MDSPVLISNR